MPYYRDLGFKKDDFPLAEAYYEMCLSLPMFPSLTNEEQEYVIENVLELLKTA
jgi:dTDP-4-amino-4,6-dideoxygalactose transaminase